MSAPWMPLWVADYLGDTRHLTTEQHGAYLLLLMCMWRAGGWLPNSDEKLARFCGLTASKWLRIKPEIMAFFDEREGQITQVRLLVELQKAEEKASKRSDAGKLGAIAKSLKNRETPQANGQAGLKHSSQSDIKKKESSNELSSADAFEAFWKSYPRKASKLASSKAYSKALARIGGDDPQAFLLAALETAKRGWTDERFTPHASTWLNGERYNDAPPSNIVSLPHERIDTPNAKHAERIGNLSEGVGVAFEIAARRRGVVGGCG
jgi:uncharacterized protein YdaU (DUF1376 family)